MSCSHWRPTWWSPSLWRDTSPCAGRGNTARPLVYRGLEVRAGGCVPRLLLYLGPALLLSILANTPRLLEMRLVTIVDTDSGNQ